MNGDPADLEVHRVSPAPAGSSDTESFPFAHRDMKPGNVMIADDGSPILMDFGSAIPARIKIETRSQALLQQVLSFSCPIRANTERGPLGYCGRTQHDGVSRPGIIRCQDWCNLGREG